MLSHGRGRVFETPRAHQPFQYLSTMNGQRALGQLHRSTPARPNVCRIEPGLTTTTLEARFMAGYDLYTIARFWAKVKVGKPTQCWPWQGGAGAKGYGRFKIEGRLVLSHHVAWELANGPLPEHETYHGAVVRHACDSPACCNWRHLRAGTQQENVQDMDIKGRRGFPGSKLTREQALAIIADPRSNRTIAASYGVSFTHVGAIKRGARLGKYTAPARDAAQELPHSPVLGQPDLFPLETAP